MTQYYVHPAGNDSNPGTLSQPWKTISKANNTLQAGDTVYLRAGEYQEIISPVNNGTATQPITYTRYQKEIPLVVGSGPDKPGVVCLGWVPNITGTGANRSLGDATWGNPKSYIVIDGLDISYKWSQDPTFCLTYTERRFAHVHIDVYESEGIVVRNCKIYQATSGLDNFMANFLQAGILACGHNCTFENNEIHGFWLGIWLGGGSPRNCIIRKNHIYDIGSSPIDCGSPLSTIIQATLIEDNILGPSWNEDGIQFEPDYAHLGEVRNLGVVIRRNLFVGCAENSIDLKGAGHILIEDNVAYGDPGQDNGGIEWDFALQKNVRDTTGTLYYTDANGSKVLINNHSGGKGFITLGAREQTSNIIVRNNIAYDNFGALGPVETAYKRFKVYNNTFVGNNRDYTGPNSKYGNGQSRDGMQSLVVYGDGGDPEYGFVFRNNLVLNHNDGEASINIFGFSPTTLNLDYNIYGNVAGTRLCDPGGGVASFYSFSQWQAHAGVHEKHSKETFSTSDQFVNVPEYPVGDYSQFDFQLKPTSNAKQAGGTLTQTSSSGSGKTITVDDADVFCDGFNVIAGDLILVGSNPQVMVMKVVDSHTLLVDQNITWPAKANVTLAKLGFTPDVGASLKAAPPLGPPVIVQQPISQSVTIGQIPIFSIFATGAAPLSYQWKRNAVDIVGANSASYSFTPTSADDGDAFTCYVSNSQEGILSNIAMLWVTDPVPTGNLIQNPSFDGESFWFFYANSPNSSFIADGIGIVTLGGTGTNIQLSQAGLPIEVGKEYTLTFEAKSVPANRMDIALLRNSSPYTNLGLNDGFDLSTLWSDFSITFTATESSADGRLMFWLAPYAHAGDVFSIDNVRLEEATSIVAPMIIIEPQSITATEGETATFTVVASGSEPLRYQWLMNGQPVYGETLPSWTIEAVSLDMNGDPIACEVSNQAGSVTSNTVILTVVASHSEYDRGYADGVAAADARWEEKWAEMNQTVNNSLDILTVQAGVQFSNIKNAVA